MANNPSPEQWAASLLNELGIPQSPGAIKALVGWERAEGGHWNNSAKYNPLNTTQAEPGSQTFRSVGQGAADIRIYDSWDQGLAATVKTLRNGRYGGIISALKAGDPGAVAKAIDQSPWGTHGSYLYSAIGGAKATGAQPFTSSPDAGSAPSPSATDPAAAPAGPSLPGASNFTGLLAQMLAKPEQQAPVSQPVAPPSFAAAPKLPQGFSPAVTSAPAAQEGASGASSLLEALRASAPTDGASGGLGVAESVSAARDAPGVAGTVQQDRANGQTSPAPSAKGTAKFEGSVVAAWIEPILSYAREHGWKGSINSGFRSYADQKRIYDSGVRPAAVPGTSNHEGSDYPRGAVDVSDAAQLAKILQSSPYAKTLVWAGSKDPVHFSHPHNGSY